MKTMKTTMTMLFLILVAGSMACDKEKTENAPDETAEVSRQGEDHGLWCREHALPESFCTKCHPELTAKYKEAGDWCEEHGYPESACPTCNPMTPPPGVTTEGEHHDDHHDDHHE